MCLPGACWHTTEKQTVFIIVTHPVHLILQLLDLLHKMWNLFYTVDVSVILITLDYMQLSVIDFLLPLMHNVSLFVFLNSRAKPKLQGGQMPSTTKWLCFDVTPYFI